MHYRFSDEFNEAIIYQVFKKMGRDKKARTHCRAFIHLDGVARIVARRAAPPHAEGASAARS
jgi:hypothetical protein